MTLPAPRQPDAHEPVAAPLVACAAAGEDADALLQGEWGYEAADPALQARLWGEPLLRFEDR